MELSHNACLTVLANPSTQVIPEALGYEYSDRGLREYRTNRPPIMEYLVGAIVKELDQHAVFPPKYRDRLPDVGVFIQKHGDQFVLLDIDKPSVSQEHVFASAESAARGYVIKMLDTYWLRTDASGNDAQANT